MKIKIYAEETYTTTLYHESMEIDTDNYPELEGMDEDQISDYVDNHIWEMKPTSDIYETLGEELMDKDVVNDHIGGEETTFYISEVQ